MLHIGNENDANPDKETEEKNAESAATQDDEKESKKTEKDNYSEAKEQMLRIAAEFDNYKKRIKKEMDYAGNLGKASLIKKLLPIIDEFEIAMLAVNDSKDKNVARGIEMLYSNFVDTLKKEGLSEVQLEGLFDPHMHEIVMVRESDEKDGTILEAVKKGYMFDGKLLRPASVIVSKSKEKTEEKKE